MNLKTFTYLVVSFSLIDTVWMDTVRCRKFGPDFTFSVSPYYHFIGNPQCDMFVEFIFHFPKTRDQCATIGLLDENDICFKLIQKKGYNVNKIVSMAHGLHESRDSFWVEHMIKTIHAVDQEAIIMQVVWGPFDELTLESYVQACGNTRLVGKAIAHNYGVLSKIKRFATHCVGYSLGAQCCAFAGKEANKMNLPIDRITGLDPAGPLFSEDNTAFITLPFEVPSAARIDKTDARFVDIWHTDGIDDDPRYEDYNNLGSLKAVGTVDIYPGQNGIFGGHQPNCSPRNTNCNHERSIFIFIETIYGSKCMAYCHEAKCKQNRFASVGYYMDTEDTRGSYILPTSYVSPYCSVYRFWRG